MIWLSDIEKQLRTRSVIVMSDTFNEVEMHGHNFIELVYIKKGSVLLTWNSKKTVLREHNYFIVDQGIMHSYQPVDDAPFELINCMFAPRLINDALPDTASLKYIINNYLIRFTDDTLAGDPTRMCFTDHSGDTGFLMDMMLKEYNEQKLAYVSMIRNSICTILLKQMRQIITAEIAESSPLCTDIKKYIGAHYSEPLTLDDISKKFGYTLPYMSKLFRQQAGQPFREYLRQYRMQQACRLLTETDLPVEEIAGKCGYGDSNSFRSVFRETVGRSPREFRRQSKANPSISTWEITQKQLRNR